MQFGGVMIDGNVSKEIQSDENKNNTHTQHIEEYISEFNVMN